ncbi:MAG: hypothetical protein FWG21_05085, partial [Oscillospiraceae bacterium]|nr:hypothetical protein [Oscillospiraceae bacterium]
PSPTGYDETIVGSNNGSITGVDSTMEYKLSTDSSWTSITGTSVTGLAPSTYNVRVAASNVNSNFYGSSTNVTINAASAICSIGSVEYGSLDAALAAVDNNETILLLENITLSDDLVINNGKEFTLNANNKTIDFDYDFLLNIYSGDVTFNNYSFDNLFLVEVYNNNGSGTSLKATFNGNLELTEGCLYTFGDGTEVFVNGDLTSQGDGVQAYAFSKVTINGNINTHGDGVLCYGGASVIVTGDISSDSRGIYAHGTQYIPDSEDIRSNVLVEGNVVAYDSGVECWAGAFVEVKGSVTSEEATGVYCNGTAEQNPTMLTEVFVRVDVYGGSGDYGAGAVAYGNGQITIDGSLVASFNRILVNGTFRDKKDNTTFKTNYDQYSNYLTMEGFNPSEDVQYLTVVWLRNPSTPKPPASSTSDPVVTTAPKTGDTVNMLTWIILLIASAFVVCTFFVIRRKRESNMQ